MQEAEWGAGAGVAGAGMRGLALVVTKQFLHPPVNEQQMTKECKCGAETSISIYMHFRRTKLFLFSPSPWFV
jgi:hypothetical protein